MAGGEVQVGAVALAQGLEEVVDRQLVHLSVRDGVEARRFIRVTPTPRISASARRRNTADYPCEPVSPVVEMRLHHSFATVLVGLAAACASPGGSPYLAP